MELRKEIVIPLGMCLLVGLFAAIWSLDQVQTLPPFDNPMQACLEWKRGRGMKMWSVHTALSWNTEGGEVTCLLLSPDGYGRVKEQVLRCSRTKGCRTQPSYPQIP